MREAFHAGRDSHCSENTRVAALIPDFEETSPGLLSPSRRSRERGETGIGNSLAWSEPGAETERTQARAEREVRTQKGVASYPEYKPAASVNAVLALLALGQNCLLQPVAKFAWERIDFVAAIDLNGFAGGVKGNKTVVAVAQMLLKIDTQGSGYVIIDEIV